MKTVKEIYEYIESNEGKTNSYGEYSIQVYDGHVVQAAIFHKDIAILKIENKGKKNNNLTFYLQNNEDTSLICYSIGVTLFEDDGLVKIYDSFSEHKNIEHVLIALLSLNKK